MTLDFTRFFRSRNLVRNGDFLRPAQWLGFSVFVTVVLGSTFRVEAAEQDGLAIAIVYDNSGSMKSNVRTAAGIYQPKWIIANRALLSVVDRVEKYATNNAAGAPKVVHTGLFVFTATGAATPIEMGPFQAEAFRSWVKKYRGPDTGTPLGITVEKASRAVLNSGMSAKHVLVITDGLNTVGPDPSVTIPRVQKAAGDTVVFTHFVAFDIDAKVFAPLKRLGVTVVGAADEAQLRQQLDFILEEKILLEKETPKK